MRSDEVRSRGRRSTSDLSSAYYVLRSLHKDRITFDDFKGLLLHSEEGGANRMAQVWRRDAAASHARMSHRGLRGLSEGMEYIYHSLAAQAATVFERVCSEESKTKMTK